MSVSRENSPTVFMTLLKRAAISIKCPSSSISKSPPKNLVFLSERNPINISRNTSIGEKTFRRLFAISLSEYLIWPLKVNESAKADASSGE
jgi:hypothetical protein